VVGRRTIPNVVRDKIFEVVALNSTLGCFCINGEFLMLGFDVSAD
jgi:hypothetical protein